MSDHQATRQVVLHMLDLYDDGTPSCYGSDRFLDLVAGDCDWAERSSDARFAGRRGDKSALQRGAARSKHTLRDRHARVTEVIAEGDRAAVLWTWSASSAEDGAKLSAEVFSTFTVADGQITRWHDRIIVDGPREESA